MILERAVKLGEDNDDEWQDSCETTNKHVLHAVNTVDAAVSRLVDVAQRE